MAAKCNITGFTLEQLNKLLWGFSCKVHTDAILENYAEYLNCSTVNLPICNEADCTNEPVILWCEDFLIESIDELPLDDPGPSYDYRFGITISGANNPYTCVWEYDPVIFELVVQDNCTIKLNVKAGIVIDDVITLIKVTVTDDKNCTGTKTCNLIGGSLSCVEYVICPNVSDLVATPLGQKNWLLEWSNTNFSLVANPNALSQTAMIRQRSLAGAWITTGFIPANNIDKNLNSTVSTTTFAQTANTVIQFKVQTNCLVNGPVDNSNGIVENIRFSCVIPVIEPDVTEAELSVDLSAYTANDITKVRFTVRNSATDVIAYQATDNSGPIFTTTATGLVTATGYYVQIEFYATVNGEEVISSAAEFLNAVCGPYEFETL